MGKATSSDGSRSFMRLQVISMLKLATLVLLATLTFILFMLLGYGAAPAPAATDFTSAPSRCTSEFSAPLFLSCAAQANVSVSLPQSIPTPSSASSSSLSSDNATSTATAAAIVDQLLRLPESDQVNVLGCMLDACSASTQRPMTVADPESELLFAHYAFNLSGLTQANRFVVMSVAFPNADITQDTTFDVTFTPHLRGYYTTNTSQSDGYLDLLLPPGQRRTQTVSVTCLADLALCEPVHFLRLADLDFDSYRVDVLLNATTPLPINGRDPMFSKTWGTKQFTHWMLGIKLFFLLTTLTTCVWFFKQIAMLSAREQTLEQTWIAALAVALVLFNDPFYVLEAATGGNAFRFLSVLFQATFVMLLLLFWLLAIDNLRLEGKEGGVSNHTFFVPKMMFIGVFWIFMVAYHAFLKFQSTNDPTWDPLHGNATVAMLKSLLALFSFMYIGWFLGLAIMSRDVIKDLRPRFRYLLVLSLWVVLVAFLSVGDGAISPTPTRGGAWTTSHALFNIYTMALEYLFAPSATALLAARQRTDQRGDGGGGGADKQPVEDPEATPALAEVAEVQLDMA